MSCIERTLALLSMVACVGCGASAGFTEVVIVVRAEAAVAQQVAVLAVRVLDTDGEVVVDRADDVGGDGGPVLPGARIPLSPRGGDAARTWTIVIEARSPTGCVLARLEESGGYEAGVSREEEVHLERATGDECPGVPTCDDGCDDGLSCTSDRCVGGSCVHEVDGSSCIIEGACVASGTSDPTEPCRTCDATRATHAWSLAATCDWVHVAALGEGEVEGARHGAAVAIDGDRVVIGAPHEGVATDRPPGRAFVFARDSGGRWSLEQELSAGGDSGDGDLFGAAVAISGDWAMVGAPKWRDGADGAVTGMVFLFEHAESGWLLRGRLSPSLRALAPGDDYGAAIAMDGALAVVGIPAADGPSESGRAAVFERQSTGRWTHIEELAATVPQARAYFGLSVALDGGRIVVGAPRWPMGVHTQAGAAYSFEARGEPGSILLPDSVERSINFGESVAISGERIVVGAVHENAGGDSAGGAYVLDLAGATVELLRPAPAGAQLGIAVAASTRWTAAGAPFGPETSGRAYVWDELASRALLPQVTTNPPVPLAKFGRTLAISDRWLVVGATDHPREGERRGAAFLIELRGP